VHDQKLSEVESIRKRLEEMLQGIGINHYTFQFECAECENNSVYCEIKTED
jgi:hypothetical protein